MGRTTSRPRIIVGASCRRLKELASKLAPTGNLAPSAQQLAQYPGEVAATGFFIGMMAVTDHPLAIH